MTRTAAVRAVPLHTVEGVPNADVSTHEFQSDDGLSLSFRRFRRGVCGDAVLLIHGLTTSSDMFIMPEHRNLVTYLLDHGFEDVWCLDFRMSNRHAYNLSRHRYTLDDCALFDHPAALRTVRAAVGDARIHVVCHCLGSLTFMMSLAGGVLDGVTSVISNSIALTPRVPAWSRVKLAVGPFLVERILGEPCANPRWNEDPGLTRGKMLSWLVSAVHRECDVPACHMLSFMWGSGFPALYVHGNMDEVTHRRARDLFGGTGMHYYRHIRRMVRAGRAVRFAPADPRHAPLPADYLARAHEVTTPILFVTGEKNRVFGDSNVVTHQLLESRVPGRHRLHTVPGYGHQDVFMGRNVATDVFPTFLEFLNAHRAASGG
jgi:hypothetical protein